MLPSTLTLAPVAQMKSPHLAIVIATAAWLVMSAGSTPRANEPAELSADRASVAAQQARPKRNRAQTPTVSVTRTLATPSGRPHDFYDDLRRLPERFADWSLRDQAQLDKLTKRGKSSYFTYEFGTDRYPRSQDGAKFFKPADDKIGTGSDSIPGNQQLKMPLGIDRGTVLITWDFWYGPEFRNNIGRVGNYKTFQVRQGDGANTDGRRWWTHLNSFDASTQADEVSRVFDAIDRTGLALAPGVERTKPITPAGTAAAGGRTFTVKHGKWTRYWMEIALAVPAQDPRWNDWKAMNAAAAKLTGSWDMLSLWIADENTAPMRILYRVPWVRKGSHISSFEFEFNTSAKPPAQTGPLVGYGRNVVVLRDYKLPAVPETDVRIFARPVP